MGIFFKSQAILPIVGTAIEDALKINPSNISNPQQEAANRAEQITQQVSGQFMWVRLIIAFALVAMLGIAVIYTAQNNLDDAYKVFLHSFELVFGVVLGLLGGEAAARS